MTTPLFLWNSHALELRDIIMSLKEGSYVEYRSHSGYIKFVCDEYVTICITEGDKRVNDVHMLVYTQNWDEIAVDPERFEKIKDGRIVAEFTGGGHNVAEHK